ncbi:ferric iron uptake transcriptional regulator [Neisseria sp. Ec49-e6-T10]|uniref:ferric iron uptake transcriptional regulator n=1 Tax=Neisseria sp. Ec49-e6-T10 TaxID=3140744 RepID=UPI003EBBDD86
MNHITHLKDNGLKVTGPRLKILELFENKRNGHLTAEDVFRMLIDEGFDVGLATVYRVLTQFEQAEILVKHHFETGKAVYELNKGSHHDHLVCIQCGKVTEFFDHDLEVLQEKIANEKGYKIMDHALYLYGVCKVCQKKS